NPIRLMLDRVEHFLGRGVDLEGKGDYQGCGEFNPLLIFSNDESAQFEEAEDKTLRNKANAPNRRVTALIFRAGSCIDPVKWPCPRWNEGTEACAKRFWLDGNDRRSMRFPQVRREFETTKDTFACRFYQRITDHSPCEQLTRELHIR